MYQNILDSIEQINKHKEIINEYISHEKLQNVMTSHVKNIKREMEKNIEWHNHGNIRLYSGYETNWFFDFVKTFHLSPQIYSLMSPNYNPVGILTGGGLISSAGIFRDVNTSMFNIKLTGLVDVKNEVFYPPRYNCAEDNHITLIDDVLSTGKSIKKAREIIEKYGKEKGEEYVIAEQKVLLYRTDIPKEENIGEIQPLFVSVQLDTNEKPKLIYVGRE